MKQKGLIRRNYILAAGLTASGYLLGDEVVFRIDARPGKLWRLPRGPGRNWLICQMFMRAGESKRVVFRGYRGVGERGFNVKRSMRRHHRERLMRRRRYYWGRDLIHEDKYLSMVVDTPLPKPPHFIGSLEKQERSKPGIQERRANQEVF